MGLVRGAVDSLALFQCGLHSKFMRAFAMGVKVGGSCLLPVQCVVHSEVGSEPLFSLWGGTLAF